METIMLRNNYFKKNENRGYASYPVWDYPAGDISKKITINFDLPKAASHAGYLMSKVNAHVKNKINSLDVDCVDNADAKHYLLAIVRGDEVCLPANLVSTIIAVCEDNHIPLVVDYLKDVYQKEVLDVLYSEDNQEPTADEKIDDLFNQFSAGNLTLNQLKAECKKLVK